MARASFTLRKGDENSSASGSYLQYPPSWDTSASATFPVQTSDDLYLKADGLQIAPAIYSIIPGGNEFYDVGTFTVDVVDYQQVHITWSLPINTSPGATPEVTQVLLCYSRLGEPDTVDEGAVLVETSEESQYFHTTTEPGWAYYTLFLKYESSSGDLYYEPGAKLSVLVPTNYGSSTELLNKIPAYYRLEDSKLDQGSGGPLERFLSVFGWDIDRMRSLLDYLISCKDPQQARSQELDLIASDLGLDTISQELGTARLRSILNDIGTIRRSNGTKDALISALTSITGSVVSITGNNIYIRPQRVNLVKDPRIAVGISTSLDGGTAFIDSDTVVDGGLYNASEDNDNNPSTPPDPDSDIPNPGSDGGYYNTSYGASVSGYWTAFIDPDNSNNTLLQTTEGSIIITAGSTFYFSTHSAAQELITSVSFDDVSASPRDPVIVSDNSTGRREVGGRYYWRLYVPNNYTGASVVGLTINYQTQSDLKADDLFDYLLLEENNVGSYFDGDTVRGGWIVDAASSISDFQWYDPATPSTPGTANESFSIYNSNFVKTKHVVNRILPLFLPVNKLVTTGTVYSNQPITVTSYTLNWNYLPGY